MQPFVKIFCRLVIILDMVGLRIANVKTVTEMMFLHCREAEKCSSAQCYNSRSNMKQLYLLLENWKYSSIIHYASYIEGDL